jgi:hypothetical protein
VDAAVAIGGGDLTVREFECIAPNELDAVAGRQSGCVLRTGFVLDDQPAMKAE